MHGSRTRSRAAVALVAVVVLLAAVPGVAQAETRSGGTVVVGTGETVAGDLDAFGGTVVVLGTVDGDLVAYGGDVRVAGTVTGDVTVFGGDVTVAGQVGGDVSVASGSLDVEPSADVGGSLSAAAGSVVVAGRVRGNADLAGGAVTLAESAAIDGDVAYAVGEDGQFVNRGALVGGTITRSEDVDAGPVSTPAVPGWVFGVYGFLVNLALGALLLFAAPRFSTDVVDRILAEPLRTGGAGVVAGVAVPVLLALTALTIIGIPLALVGGLLFVLGLWVALVLGRYAAGTWLLHLVDVDNRWAALLVGLVVFGLASRLPWVGGVVDLVVVLLGLGAATLVGRAGYRS